ncbi:MAG TPA: hypothetical protein VKR82_12100 [Candidatus Acidoferrales bacterium]|nr:hypothetical protein [Candidatus Acidoferrales bacterium]
MSQIDNSGRGRNEGHVDEMSCLQYLEGLLERPRALEFSAHTEQCSDCRALLRALERESKLLSFALREQEESVPARLLAGPARERTPWGWIVSFGLAASGAYWVWTSIIDPWQAQLAQAGFGGSDLLSTVFIQSALWKGWDTMWTMVQALAVISLGLVGFLLLRRTLRRWNTIALMMTVIVAALALPLGVSAIECHKANTNYTLPADRVVHDDLLVSGQTVRIDGTVDGDLFIFGQNLTVNGHVTGDVISAGSMLTISGTVDGNVRASLGVLNIHGKVGKNVMGFTGTLLAESQSEIGWGAILYAGDATMDGRIGRGITGRMGHASLDGFVGGDVSIKANDSFDVGPHAQLLGKVQYTGPSQPAVAAGARLSNPIDVNIEAKTSNPDYIFSGMSLWHKLLFWGASFIFGLVLLFIAPGFFNETVQTADRFGVSLGVGALVMIATPVLACIACFTVVGLGIGISTALLYLIALYGSKVFFAAWLGRGIFNWGRSKAGTAGPSEQQSFRTVTASGAMVGHLALGLVILYAVRIVPYVGFWLAVMAVVWGFGAMSITLFSRMRHGAAAI